jgi:acetyl esterase
VAHSDGVEVEDVSMPVGVMVRIFRNREAPKPTPVVLYLSDVPTDGAESERNGDGPRGLAAATGAAVLVPTSPPDAGLEPLYAVLCWVAQQGARRWLDGSRVALAGEGMGAELCSRLALLARDRGTPSICAGLLLWPVPGDHDAHAEAARFLGAALRGSGVAPAYSVSQPIRCSSKKS